MGRLIEIEACEALPPSLVVWPGDLLLLAASGAHLRDGAEVVEVLGPYSKSVVGINHQVLTPMGSPNAVLVVARQPGRARLDIVTGDPWQGAHTARVDLIVTSDPAGPSEPARPSEPPRSSEPPRD
jgi:hypothetical protein